MARTVNYTQLRSTNGRVLRWVEKDRFELENPSDWSAAERKELVIRMKTYFRCNEHAQHAKESTGEDIPDGTLDIILEWNDTLLQSSDPIKRDYGRLMEFCRFALQDKPNFDPSTLDALLV